MNITPLNVLESTLMYGIVHSIWKILKYLFNKAEKETRAERNRIIQRHVKAGHKGRLKECLDEACLSLRTPELVQPEHYHLD